MKKENTTAYVGIDVSKDKLAVAVADDGSRAEVLSLGSVENTPAAIDKLLAWLSGRASNVIVCYEAGPTG